MARAKKPAKGGQEGRGAMRGRGGHQERVGGARGGGPGGARGGQGRPRARLRVSGNSTSTGPEENLLRSPWLWGGGQTYWIALRHRSRGAPPTHGGGRPKP